jgi:hypothetical protein
MLKSAHVSGYKILRFWDNLQKYQTLVPAKDSHLKVVHSLVPRLSEGGGEREPGTDRSRMRLIYQHSGNFVYHWRYYPYM